VVARFVCSLRLFPDRKKGGGDVGDPGVVVAEEDGDDVEKDFLAGWVFGNEAAGSADKLAAFVRSHVYCRVEAVAFPEALDFDYPDSAGVFHHHVNLVMAAAPVPCEQVHSQPLQIAESGIFARTAQILFLFVCFHAAI